MIKKASVLKMKGGGPKEVRSKKSNDIRPQPWEKRDPRTGHGATASPRVREQGGKENWLHSVGENTWTGSEDCLKGRGRPPDGQTGRKEQYVQQSSA